MEIINSIILGVVQGLTEYLPVSSSGHLVLAEHFLGMNASGSLVFEVLVHFATMIAVIIYFRNKIGKLISCLIPPYTAEKMPYLKLAGIIVIGTIPAVIAGLMLEDKIEAAFGSPRLVTMMLIITGLILLSTRLRKLGSKSVGYGSGFWIGMTQALALLPGISRSGSTMAAGLHLKIAPAEAAEFSFLLSLPAVFGASVLKTFDLAGAPITQSPIALIAGALASLIVGYLSISWLMKLIRRGQFFYFGIYCLIVGLVGVIWL